MAQIAPTNNFFRLHTLETIGYKKYMQQQPVICQKVKLMLAKEKSFNNAASSIEELSDEALTACVGGNSEEQSLSFNATLTLEDCYNASGDLEFSSTYYNNGSPQPSSVYYGWPRKR